MPYAVIFPGQGAAAPGAGAPWVGHPAWSVVTDAEAVARPAPGPPPAGGRRRRAGHHPVEPAGRLPPLPRRVVGPRPVADRDARPARRLRRPLARARSPPWWRPAPSTPPRAPGWPPAGPTSRRSRPTPTPAAWPPSSAATSTWPSACATPSTTCGSPTTTPRARSWWPAPPPPSTGPSRSAPRSASAGSSRWPSATPSTRPCWPTPPRGLRPLLDTLPYASPTAPVVANTDGLGHTDPACWPDQLTRHLVEPVRWRACQLALRAAGAGTFVEVGPGGVLAGLAKRTVPDVTVISVSDPDGLGRLGALGTPMEVSR